MMNRQSMYFVILDSWIGKRCGMISYVLGRDICKKSTMVHTNSFITLIIQYRFILSLMLRSPDCHLERKKSHWCSSSKCL